MAVTRERSTTWQRGAEGEEIAEREFLTHGITPPQFWMRRNLRFDLPDLMARKPSVRYQLAGIEVPEGTGDIDFLIVGTTGVYVWDAKHLSDADAPQHDYERMAAIAGLEAEYIYLGIEDALMALGTGIHAGLVMTNDRPSAGGRSLPYFAIVSPLEAVEAMKLNPPVMDEATAARLIQYVDALFEPMGDLNQRRS